MNICGFSVFSAKMPAICPILFDSSIACYKSDLLSFRVKFESNSASLRDLIWEGERESGWVNRDWKRLIKWEVLAKEVLARVVIESVNFVSFGEKRGSLVWSLRLRILVFRRTSLWRILFSGCAGASGVGCVECELGRNLVRISLNVDWKVGSVGVGGWTRIFACMRFLVIDLNFPGIFRVAAV
jgi:hypothetical protein